MEGLTAPISSIIHNGLSYDGQSAYPDKDCNERMPVGTWFEYPDPSPERICKLAREGKKAMLMHIALRDVELLRRLGDVFGGCQLAKIVQL